MGGLQEQGCAFVTERFVKDGLAAVERKIASEIWTTVIWTVYEDNVPPDNAGASHCGVENDLVVWKPGLLKHCMGSD